ncbi:MAG: ROK family protein [Bacteroidaceae bacterium]|nr:ROK family protein [Bacteroidaceae bacterium]
MKTDKPTVLTLDAGGTNFVFSAICDNEEVIEPVRLKAVTTDTEGCLATLVQGFTTVKEQLGKDPVAISFAFPGPADYARGVIGDLPNFPSFRGGVALGPYLESVFGIPVYVNNDGNLFAYGEALAGALPRVNKALEESGCKRRYKNLIGVTLGTGFGCGVVIDKVLLTGDNGCGGDVWCMRNGMYPFVIAEESVSIRAVRRVYAEMSHEPVGDLTPKDIGDIANGTRPGNAKAAQESFRQLGQVTAATLVNVLNIVDGIVVIGGGLSHNARWILPGMMEEFARPVGTFTGSLLPTLQSEVYNFEDVDERAAFLKDKDVFIDVPHTDKKVLYCAQRKVAVTISELGASKAINLGAYNYALQQLGR